MSCNGSDKGLKRKMSIAHTPTSPENRLGVYLEVNIGKVVVGCWQVIIVQCE